MDRIKVNKGDKMSKTYEITAPNSAIINVDKQSNEIIFDKDEDDGETGKYTKEYSKAIFEAYKIMQSSKTSYKPNYLDPNYYTGQKSHLSEFKAIQKLYYKDP
ncbi:hypothetical protein CQA53_11930, partial [Helicobacter didelphidarum]